MYQKSSKNGSGSKLSLQLMDPSEPIKSERTSNKTLQDDQKATNIEEEQPLGQGQPHQEGSVTLQGLKAREAEMRTVSVDEGTIIIHQCSEAEQVEGGKASSGFLKSENSQRLHTPKVTSFRSGCNNEMDAVSAAPDSVQDVHKIISQKAKLSLSKDRRAARTMAVIVSTFIVCWLPFFLMYVIVPFCSNCQPPSQKVS